MPATINYQTGREYKLVCLRETLLPEQMPLTDTPEAAARYWRYVITGHPYFNPDVEQFFVLMLNSRRRVFGHTLVSHGTLDTILVHPREVFRAAVVAGASAIIAVHNHPSGDSSPSEADIKVTRDLIRGGQLLKIELLDHIIVGYSNGQHTSLRALGYFYS